MPTEIERKIRDLKDMTGEFAADLRPLSDADLESALGEAQDKIDELEAWVEALKAEQGLRAIKAALAN